jgi:hypothetical protein
MAIMVMKTARWRARDGDAVFFQHKREDFRFGKPAVAAELVADLPRTSAIADAAQRHFEPGGDLILPEHARAADIHCKKLQLNDSKIHCFTKPGSHCYGITFREAATLYLEARPPSPQWRADIARLCAVIGDRPLVDIKHHVLVDAASMLYRDYLPGSKNCHVFGSAGAVIHYAAKNELCPDVRIGKLAS